MTRSMTRMPAGAVTPPSPYQPLIVERLSLRLGTFHLQDISFSLKPGRVTVLLGHNGAGKTTTMRLIMGLIHKDSGNVRIGECSHAAERTFRHRVGFVPEEGHFYGAMTVEQVITFASGFYSDWDGGRSSELGRMLGLDLSKRIRDLSKGSRMKVSLILALSHSPDVLLMDEPTSGLDPVSRASLLKLIRASAEQEGRSVLFSTHNLREAEQVADDLVIVDSGRILIDSSLEEARRQPVAGATGWSLESYYLGLVQ